MQTQGSQDTPQGGACCAGGTCKPDITAILSRAREVIVNPKGCWDEIKAEQKSIKEIYICYVLVLAAIGPVCTLIANFSGAGIVMAVISYGLSVAGLLLWAWIINFLAPKFDGTSSSLLNAFKLSAYSATPQFLAGVFVLVPIVGPILALLGLYSLYCYYQGITPMVGVPESKRLIFCILSIIAVAIAWVIIWMVLVTPIIIAMVGTTSMMAH